MEPEDAFIQFERENYRKGFMKYVNPYSSIFLNDSVRALGFSQEEQKEFYSFLAQKKEKFDAAYKHLKVGDCVKLDFARAKLAYVYVLEPSDIGDVLELEEGLPPFHIGYKGLAFGLPRGATCPLISSQILSVIYLKSSLPYSGRRGCL